MPIRLGIEDANLVNWVVAQAGFGPVGNVYHLAKASGAWETFVKKKKSRQLVQDEFIYATGPYGPYNACVTYENDVVLVANDAHTWVGDSGVEGDALTWSKYCTHMIGLAPFSKGGGPRARFSHSGYAMANFLTMSGWNNLFKNLYWMHGSATGGASDVTLATISGAYSVFERCHFGGPNDQTQASDADYAQIVSSGSQNYFKDCLFGGMNAIHRDAANTILKFSGGGGVVFEDCIFWSRSAATSPYFINISSTSTGGIWRAIFLNCQFINMSTLHGSWDLAVGITSTPGESDENYLYFDNRCSMAGVTDIIADANEEMVKWGGAGASPDTSAINDRVNLGIAGIPNHTA